MNILLLDDDATFLDYIQENFTNHEVHLKENPISWLDSVSLNKTDLNYYDYIFCDLNFENININAIDLNLSKYIREQGFKNKIILFSYSSGFYKDSMPNNYFNYILDKLDLEKLNQILSEIPTTD